MDRVRLTPTAKGLDWVRLAIATALASDRQEQAAIIARNRWGEDSRQHRILKTSSVADFMFQKSSVAAGAAAIGNWAAELVSLESAATEFFSLVRERSLIGKIEGLRRVPLRTRLVSAATGFSAAWIGEGKAKAVGRASFNADNLPSRKVASLAVFTEELLENIEPAAELLIRNDMVNAMVAAIDASFIDPSNGGTPDIEPASITNGAPGIAASGDGLQDLRELIASFPGDLERAILIGSPATFAVMHEPLIIPGLGVRGGEAIGIPAVASTAAGSTLALVDPDGIALGEGDMELRTSREGTIEMSDAPAQDATTPQDAEQVSLWQTNSVAILSEKRINWSVARPSVSVVTGEAPS